MGLWTRFSKFAADQNGAVTVDMVALMAALLLLGLAVAITINQATVDFSDEIAAEVDEQDVWTF